MNQDDVKLDQWLFDACPEKRDAFFRDCWMRRPYFVERQAPGLFDAIITPAAINEIVSCRNARYPEVTMAREGKPIALPSYASTANVNGVTIHRIESDRVADLFEQGANLLLRSIHTGHPSVARLTCNLEEFFRARMTAICFVSPPKSASFPRHTDPTGTLVFQVAGTKLWFIADAADPSASTLVTMRPGSVLYLPPNWPHYVCSSQDIAISVNYAIESMSWRELLGAAVDDILDDPAFDAAVALGQSLDTSALEHFKQGLAAALHEHKLLALIDKKFEAARLQAPRHRPLLKDG